MYSRSEKYENKSCIPRMLWFHKEETLEQMWTDIVMQFSFAQDTDTEEHNPLEYFEKHY